MPSLTHFIIAAATLAFPIAAQSNCTSRIPQSFNATGSISKSSFPGNLTRYITSDAAFSNISDTLVFSLEKTNVTGRSICVVAAKSIAIPTFIGSDTNCSAALTDPCAQALSKAVSNSLGNMRSASAYCNSLSSAFSTAAADPACKAFSTELGSSSSFSSTLTNDTCPKTGSVVTTLGNGEGIYAKSVGSVIPVIVGDYQAIENQTSGVEGGSASTSFSCLGVRVEEGSKAAPSVSPTADAPKETETKKPNSAGRGNVAWGFLVGGLVAVGLGTF